MNRFILALSFLIATPCFASAKALCSSKKNEVVPPQGDIPSGVIDLFQEAKKDALRKGIFRDRFKLDPGRTEYLGEDQTIRDQFCRDKGYEKSDGTGIRKSKPYVICIGEQRRVFEFGMQVALSGKNPPLLDYYLSKMGRLRKVDYLNLIDRAMEDDLPNSMGQVVISKINRDYPALGIYQNFFSKPKLNSGNPILNDSLRLALPRLAVDERLPIEVINSTETLAHFIEHLQGRAAVFYNHKRDEAHWSLIVVDRTGPSCRLTVVDAAGAIRLENQTLMEFLPKDLICKFRVAKELIGRQTDRHSCSAFAVYDYQQFTELNDFEFNDVMDGEANAAVVSRFFEISQSKRTSADPLAGTVSPDEVKFDQIGFSEKWEAQLKEHLDMDVKFRDFIMNDNASYEGDTEGRLINTKVKKILRTLTLNTFEALLPG